MNSQLSICVYCGSQKGNNSAIRVAANRLGKAMAAANIRLVYGGGTKGIMGEVAKAVADNGGEVLGIIPRFLINLEANEADLHKLGEVVVTEDMHERKHRMFESSDAFVTLPGGVGTLEEIIEIITWAQLGRHQKPMVLANIDGFWDPLLTLITHMNDEGFLHSQDRMVPDVVSDPEQIVPTVLARLEALENGSQGIKDVIEKM